MNAAEPEFEARLARDEAEVRAAFGLRYQIFVEELGGDGPLVDHGARIERDEYDAQSEHLILIDHARGGRIVGVHRLMTDARAAAGLGFYSAREYDLAPLLGSRRRLLELGRSCLHPDVRGGAAMFLMWKALAEYVLNHGVEILFGVASFRGTDVVALAQPLSFLHHFHLAPPALRVRVLPEFYQRMDLLPETEVDRKAAAAAMPALIKAYLRLGGCVGEGAFVDRAFNTTDVFVMMDTARMNTRQRDFYARPRP